jgi:transposase
MDRLSSREREVMRLIARGYAYKEVASELFISIKTVESHVSAVLRNCSSPPVTNSRPGRWSASCSSRTGMLAWTVGQGRGCR